MKIRDRIKEFKRIPANELLPNPKNWRTHSDFQKDAMQGILAEIGFAGASLVRETLNGYMLIDGHLRTEIAPFQEVPVLVLDVTAEEADKILLTYDSVTGLAELDEAQFSALAKSVSFESEAIQEMLKSMGNFCLENDNDENDPTTPKDVPIPEVYQILVTCIDVEQQEELYNRFSDEGLQCKLVNL